MKKFLNETILFISILLAIFIIGILLPATPRASKSLLFSKITKDSLLENVPSPRIIFVGGSNLSFGLNSQIIKDSLGLNPINTSLSMTVGLVYMMDNIIVHIKKGDIVLLIPEYNNYFGNFSYGGEYLLPIIIDVSPTNVLKLKREQLFSIWEYLPKYSFSKYNPKNYIPPKYINNISSFKKDDLLYGINSFNEYGDVYTHWNMDREIVKPFDAIEEEFNYLVIDEMLNFENKLGNIGSTLYVSFPGLQETSFENSKSKIMNVEYELKKNKFHLLGNPERYKFPNSLIFNFPYHLTKEGLDIRTKLLIEDIKKSRLASLE